MTFFSTIISNTSVLLNFFHELIFKCCLCIAIHIAVTMLRHILYLICLCPCLSLGLLMPYLRGLRFIFCLIFIAINHITSFKQTYLLLVHFLKYLLLFLDDYVMKKVNNFQIAKVKPHGVA